jgi:tetratricopeptide (TPR) repeat protein
MQKPLFSLLMLTVAIALVYSTASARSLVLPFVSSQNQDSKEVSKEEMQALQAIDTAATTEAKLAAAEAFLKKYPKTTAREQVLEALARVIAQEKDAAQAVTLAERAQSLYVSADEQDIIKPILVEVYSAANRPDDAFKLGSELLAKDPENVRVLVQLTLTGTEQIKQKNTKYATQSLQYGLKSIELIEADKKPVKMSDALWASHKAALPQLYQQTAIIYLVTGNTQEAKNRLAKTSSLNPKDPYPYALLGFILNDEYTKQVPAFQGMAAGEAKDTERKKLEGLLDNIIDVYAHAVGLGTGRAEYQPLLQQIVPDLTGYYKYRHNQSTEGLQTLIDKYKPQP